MLLFYMFTLTPYMISKIFVEGQCPPGFLMSVNKCYGVTPNQNYSADQAGLACSNYQSTMIPSGDFVCQQIAYTITVSIQIWYYIVVTTVNTFNFSYSDIKFRIYKMTQFKYLRSSFYLEQVWICNKIKTRKVNIMWFFLVCSSFSKKISESFEILANQISLCRASNVRHLHWDKF